MSKKTIALTGRQPVTIETDDTAARIARAVKFLDAIQIEDDQWAYYADETRSWWAVYDSDLLELPRYLDDDASGGYSMWCADYTGREMPSGYDPRE